MTKIFGTKDIIERPIEAYEEFHIRLKKFGQMASFPEFKEVVDFLVDEIKSPYVQDIIDKNKILKLELDEVLTFLVHVNLSFKVDEDIDYPYLVPFEEPYPYRPTIDAIESAVRFLDKVNRLDPNNKAVKLYHFDRYCYHRHSLITNENVILFPTLSELSLVDFIKTRCVPIEFVGVISKTLRVDGHQQSPLDFWYHDMNHARRLFAYILRKINKRKITVEMEKYQYFREMYEFTENVIVKKLCDISEDMNEEEQAIRKLATLIIFEIIHETALTIEKEDIIYDMLRRTGPQPFEFMSKNENTFYEDLRTPTGNLQSGATHFKDELDATTHVRYFLDPTSIGLLANIFNKINHYYYDDENTVFEHLVPAKYRSPDSVLKAAKLIFSALEYKEIPDDQELLDMIVNREGTKEKSLSKPINDEAENSNQVATDPLKADEIIVMMQKLKKENNKKVLTIFGYSGLGYQDVDALKKELRGILEKITPKDYYINIGATEDGIGCIYEIAKELGFETIGVVSNLALSYSGKFSDYVEKIYIVNDTYWGGFVPGTKQLADTTKIYLAVSDEILAFGGGYNTAVTFIEAKKIGIPTKYTPFEMNHEQALKQSKGEVVDFRGQAYNAIIENKI